MIKSGGLNFCSIATSFIPDLKKVIQFEELCNISGFTKHCLNSGHNLDNVVHNICESIAEGTNYFKVIIQFKLLSQVHILFRKTEFIHFYMYT